MATKNVSICNLIRVVLNNVGNFKEEISVFFFLFPKETVFWPTFNFLMVLEARPEALSMLGKNSIVELHNQPLLLSIHFTMRQNTHHTAHWVP